MQKPVLGAIVTLGSDARQRTTFLIDNLRLQSAEIGVPRLGNIINPIVGQILASATASGSA